MALSNSTTLSSLVGEIVSRQVQSAAYANRVMRPLVRGVDVPPGAGSVVVPRFQKVSVAALTEGTAPSSTTMNTDGVTLTPQERGVYAQISKRALHADPFSDLAPYGEQLGRALAEDEDAQVLSVTNFTTVINGTGTDPLAIDDLLTGVATLEANNAPGPYFAVFHPNSWAKLRNALGAADQFASVGRQIVEGFGEGLTNMNGFVGAPYGIPCFISTQVGSNADATPRRNNILFSKEAATAAWIKQPGVDVDDNVVSRAFDLMAWHSIDTAKLVDEYGVVLEDTEA